MIFARITPTYQRRIAAQAALMVRTDAMPSLQEFYDAIGQARAQYRERILSARRQEENKNQLRFDWETS